MRVLVFEVMPFIQIMHYALSNVVNVESCRYLFCYVPSTYMY